MKQNSQTATILRHLKRKSSISAVDAWDAYKVRSLPRRIKDLRAMGYRINSERKVHDITGQRYVRYHLLSHVPGEKPVQKRKQGEQSTASSNRAEISTRLGKLRMHCDGDDDVVLMLDDYYLALITHNGCLTRIGGIGPGARIQIDDDGRILLDE